MKEAQQKAIAYDLANKLGDVKSLGVYEAFVRKYSLEFLDEILQVVLSTPERNIKRSRGAYFTFLVNNRSNGRGYDTRN
jgi:hypothetical protein